MLLRMSYVLSECLWMFFSHLLSDLIENHTLWRWQPQKLRIHRGKVNLSKDWKSLGALPCFLKINSGGEREEIFCTDCCFYFHGRSHPPHHHLNEHLEFQKRIITSLQGFILLQIPALRGLTGSSWDITKLITRQGIQKFSLIRTNHVWRFAQTVLTPGLSAR